MARRRPMPTQLDFLGALDAAPAHGSPKPALEVELRQHLQDALSPGVPSCLRHVIYVKQFGDELCATVEVFDGLIHGVAVRGSRDTIRSYSWTNVHVPFGWDARAGRWRRYPERRRASA